MDIVGENNNTKFLSFIKYTGIFVLFYFLQKAGINNQFYPFYFGLYFAVIWCNQNVFITSVLFILASFLKDYAYVSVIYSACFVLPFIIIYGIHYKLKKPIKDINMLIYACVCLIPKTVLSICVYDANIYFQFVEILIGLLFTFSTMRILETFCVKGICGRLTTTEAICGLFTLSAIFCGISSLGFGNINLIYLFGLILLLIVGYIANTASVLLITASIGMGALMCSINIYYLTIFLIIGLTICAFKTKNKYITSVAVLMSICIIGFYFKLIFDFNVTSVIPFLLAILIFMIVPNKFLDKYSKEFQETLGSLTQQSVVNRNREMLYHRLMELSDVFSEMDKVFRSMIRGGLAENDAKRLLLNEVKAKNCSGCSNFNKCYRTYIDDTLSALNHIVDAGFEKGKVNLLDVPTIFAGKCEKLNAFVNSVNELIDQYKSYAGLVNNIDASKVLLAEQLSGISDIMKDLSLEVNRGVNFELGKEKKIISELTYNNVICSDALVFQDSNEVMSVTVAIRKEDALKKSIIKVISKICGHKMEVSEEISSKRAGWQVLSLKSAPKYDIVFGISARTKTGSVKSGDCYSIIKIKDDKYLLALCDGMGSGNRAEQTSSTAIGLVENFYKAGFEKEIIISSVNKLLSLGKDDVFSALDLCVVDLRQGVADFIKLGAPEGYVKHKDTTDIIELGALPLGIVQSAEPKSKQFYLTSGDKIVLVTDGIADGFESVDKLRDFINNLSTNNPQKMAEEIIDKALSLNKNIARDDMSVIVAKIFEK